MKKTLAFSMLTGLSVMLVACGSESYVAEEASFPIMDPQRDQIGTLTITSLKGGGVDLNVVIGELEPGKRAMHIHENGNCVGPDFKSAGGHYNPASVQHGEHAGDMMNVDVGADGTGNFTVKNMNVNLRSGDLPALMDSNGSALVIHGGADDYTSQPSGAAGPRVACAVIPAG